MKFSSFLTEQEHFDPSAWKDMTPVVISPGRFNPPHLGHKLMIDELIQLGKELNAEPVVIIVDSGKRDEKNPLSGDIRKQYLSKMFPRVRFEIAHNPYDAVERLGKEHNQVPVGGVTGSDRGGSYKKMIGRIYGSEAEQNYHSHILERDPDASDDVAGVSASKVRQAASDNNINKVRAMTGLGQDDAIKLTNAIRGTTA